MTKELKYSLLLIFFSILILMLRVPLENLLIEIDGDKLQNKIFAGSSLRFILTTGLLLFIIKKGFLPFNGLYPFKVSNIFLLLIPVVIILFLAYSSYEIYFRTDLSLLALFALDQGFVGIFEELLFRGIIFPLLILHFAGKEKPIMKAAILSSILFGLVHLIGLIRNPENFWNVVNTVIFATGIGFLFVFLLLRTRNILVPIFIHFLIDFTNAAGDLEKEVAVEAAPDLSTIILTLVVIILMSAFFIGTGLFLNKRVQVEEWLRKVSFIKI